MLERHILALIARDRDRGITLLGCTFILKAEPSNALCVTAAHVLHELSSRDAAAAAFGVTAVAEVAAPDLGAPRCDRAVVVGRDRRPGPRWPVGLSQGPVARRRSRSRDVGCAGRAPLSDAGGDAGVQDGVGSSKGPSGLRRCTTDAGCRPPCVARRDRRPLASRPSLARRTPPAEPNLTPQIAVTPHRPQPAVGDTRRVTSRRLLRGPASAPDAHMPDDMVRGSACVRCPFVMCCTGVRSLEGSDGLSTERAIS